MWPEVFNLPLYAASVSGRGRWLLRAPVSDPFLPATAIISSINEPTYAGHARRSGEVIPFDHTKTLSRAEIGNASWRDDLLQLAKLVDLLSPERDDPEAFCIKKNAVSHELRRLAKWRPHP
jgi:hypothetical protein